MDEELASMCMKIIFFLSIFLMTITIWATPRLAEDQQPFDVDKLSLPQNDIVIAKHLVNMLKFTEKGYINQDILKKVIKETEKSKHFKVFVPWLKEIQEISKINSTPVFLKHCRRYLDYTQTLPLEKALEKRAGNYCRERTLESISRDIDKQQKLGEDASLFIQQNLRFFLTKKNKKNFSSFLQSQANKPEILKKLSLEVTSYSVRNEIIPSQEVLKDILLNEQLTGLIQDKGFNPLQHKNVFYAEYGKLIELGYKTLDGNPTEKKLKQHYSFLKNYFELNRDHLPAGLCLKRLNDFGKAVFRTGFKELSREVLKFIIKKNEKEILEDSQYFYLWTYISNNEYKEAKKIAEQLGLLKNSHVIADTRLKFWIAHIKEELGETIEASSLYEELITNSPLSFYSIMSNKKLQQIKPDSKVLQFYINHSKAESNKPVLLFSDFTPDHLSSMIRLKAWSTINSKKFLELELKRINSHSQPELIVKKPINLQLKYKSELHLVNAKIIRGINNYLATFKYLYEVLEEKELEFNKTLLETLYPTPYLDALRKSLKNASIDPYIVLSLIRQESVFNPSARSPVGARGLMQLMPKTARRFKKYVSTKQLANPNLNIELGIKYFKTLMKRYDGNLVYVLAAYNAGEARVERWKGQYFDSDESILKNIESIPFLETRNYVKLIFRNIFFYKLLLDKKTPEIDPRESNKIFDVYLGFNK